MPSSIATVLYLLGICGLFALDRDPENHTSKAIWIPVLWLIINGSRPVSQWLQVGPRFDSPGQYLEGSPIDALVFGALLVAGLLVLSRRRSAVGAILRRNGPLLLFFGYCALSIAWSDYPFVAFKRWIKATGDVVMVLVVLTSSGRLGTLKRTLTRPAFLLIPLSVLLVKYYPDLSRVYNRWTWEPMYAGVATGKNMLGMTCMVFGIASVWRFFLAVGNPQTSRRSRRLIAHAVVIGMAVWLLWTCDSMTSLSCFLLASSLIVGTSSGRLGRKPIVVHLLVFLMIVAASSTLLIGNEGMLQTVGRDSTLTGRTEIWNVVLSVADRPLVGAGFESFWLGDRVQRIWKLTERGINEAHNGYLEVFLNLGWVGVTLLGLLLLTGYRKAVIAFRRDPEIGRLNVTYFTVAVIYSLTEAGFRMMSLVWIMFLLATTAVPAAAATGESLNRRSPFAAECNEPAAFEQVG